MPNVTFHMKHSLVLGALSTLRLIRTRGESDLGPAIRFTTDSTTYICPKSNPTTGEALVGTFPEQWLSTPTSLGNTNQALMNLYWAGVVARVIAFQVGKAARHIYDPGPHRWVIYSPQPELDAEMIQRAFRRHYLAQNEHSIAEPPLDFDFRTGTELRAPQLFRSIRDDMESGKYIGVFTRDLSRMIHPADLPFLDAELASLFKFDPGLNVIRLMKDDWVSNVSYWDAVKSFPKTVINFVGVGVPHYLAVLSTPKGAVGVYLPCYNGNFVI